MNASLKILRLSSVEDNFSGNLVSLDILLSKHATMTNKDNCDNVLKSKETEEVMMNEDQLMYIDEDHIDRSNVDTIYSEVIARNSTQDTGSIKASKTTGSSQHIYINNRITQRTTKNNCDQQVYNPSWSTGPDIGDVVCFGATSLIMILLLSLLVFYVYKDNESDMEI